MLLRKQTSYTGEVFQVKMTFNPRRPGYEAGVVLWWNSYSYATVGLTAATEPEAAYKKTVIIRTPTGRPGEMRVSFLVLRASLLVCWLTFLDLDPA